MLYITNILVCYIIYTLFIYIYMSLLYTLYLVIYTLFILYITTIYYTIHSPSTVQQLQLCLRTNLFVASNVFAKFQQLYDQYYKPSSSPSPLSDNTTSTDIVTTVTDSGDMADINATSASVSQDSESIDENLINTETDTNKSTVDSVNNTFTEPAEALDDIDVDVDEEFNEFSSTSSISALATLPTPPITVPIFDFDTISFKHRYITYSSTTTATLTTGSNSTDISLPNTTLSAKPLPTTVENEEVFPPWNQYAQVLENALTLTYTDLPHISTTVTIDSPCAAVTLASTSTSTSLSIVNTSLAPVKAPVPVCPSTASTGLQRRLREESEGGEVTMTITAEASLSDFNSTTSIGAMVLYNCCKTIYNTYYCVSLYIYIYIYIYIHICRRPS